MYRFCGRLLVALIALSLASIPGGVSAQQTQAAGEESGAPSETERDASKPIPTLGGMQFWTDQLFFHKWRIQRNAITGHCRLLDGKNLCHAWGSFAECQDALETIKQSENLSIMSGRAVILLHGLADPRRSMSSMARYLEKTGQYTVFNLAYASTRGSVEEHASALARVLERLEGIDEIHFVAHSLGCLVIRYYFGNPPEGKGNSHPDPRIRRFVMLGPPNHGAKLAEQLGRNALFEFFAGASGRQLAHGWDELEPKLAIPPCQFGIIAGGQGNAIGRNPLINGDDDLIVSVDETRLVGAHDFIVLPVFHAIMMSNPQVMQLTANFLEHGHFVSDQQRQPIEK